MNIIGQEIDKFYGKQQVLYQLEFEISLDRPGVVGLIGPNGAGKSTLMRLLGGITLPNAGQLILAGDSSSKDYGAWSRVNSYYAPAGERGLRNKLSTKDNLRYFTALRGESIEASLENLSQVASLINAEDLINKDFDQMSTGQKKKAELMVAVALNAKMLLLDEPSNGLDIDSQTSLMRLINRIDNIEGKKVIVSSHDPSLLANVVSQYIFISKGHILKVLDSALEEAELRELYEQLYDGND